MVCSLDGFIARTDGDVSWMESKHQYEKGVELTPQIIANFLDRIDCYLMGSKTYEHSLELGWPYGEKPVFVVTNKNLPNARETVSFHSGDLVQLVNEVLRARYTSIWMVGGSQLTRSFLDQGLADEIVVTQVPHILGAGIPFFDRIRKEIPLHLKDVTAFKDGMVEMTYGIL